MMSLMIAMCPPESIIRMGFSFCCAEETPGMRAIRIRDTKAAR